MIVLIDNLDSYTYNLLHLFQKQGILCECLRIDEIDSLEDLNKYDGIILSPGPGNPKDYHKLNSIIDMYWRIKPFLGICLGHQSLGYYFGSEVKRMDKPMHGKVSKMKISKTDKIFEGIANTIKVVRYHSLVLDNLPDSLVILGKSEDGVIMAFRHKNLPIYGIQFHPEAILSEKGEKIIQNWLSLSLLIK